MARTASDTLHCRDEKNNHLGRTDSVKNERNEDKHAHSHHPFSGTVGGTSIGDAHHFSLRKEKFVARCDFRPSCCMRKTSATKVDDSLHLTSSMFDSFFFCRLEGGEGVGPSRLQGHHRVQAPQVARARGRLPDPQPPRPQGVLRDHLREERQVMTRTALAGGLLFSLCAAVDRNRICPNIRAYQLVVRK